MHILLLKGKGHEWGPVYRDYLSLFTHDQAEFSEVDIADIIAVNEAIESSEYAGYVITGSTDDAHDSADYVLNLIERVKELNARDAVLIGICYGHQLISRALGGLTGPSDKGWGTGPRRTALADSEASEFLQSCARAYDRWQEALVQEHEKDFKGGELKLLPIEGAESKDTFNIFYSHQDQVMKPPPDLRCLGGNHHCPFAGFYSPKKSILTFQGHPEFDTDLMLQIIDMLNSRGVYKKMGYTETLDEIVSDINSNYGPTNGQAFSSSLDNIFLGKCIVSLFFSQ